MEDGWVVVVAGERVMAMEMRTQRGAEQLHPLLRTAQATGGAVLKNTLAVQKTPWSTKEKGRRPKKAAGGAPSKKTLAGRKTRSPLV